MADLDSHLKIKILPPIVISKFSIENSHSHSQQVIIFSFSSDSIHKTCGSHHKSNLYQTNPPANNYLDKCKN